jgi:hypothetical protein
MSADIEPSDWHEINRGPRKHRKGMTSRMHRPVHGGAIAEPTALGWPPEFAYVECQRCGIAFGNDSRQGEPGWSWEIAHEEATAHNEATHPILLRRQSPDSGPTS